MELINLDITDFVASEIVEAEIAVLVVDQLENPV
jgi:hypothetical protein